MGLLIRAGLEGIRHSLEAPAVMDRPVEELSDTQLTAAGIARLPASLPEALQHLGSDEVLRNWFSPDFLQVFQAVRTDELRLLEGLDPATKCKLYADVY
jgi:glutamine synthetase